MEKLKRVELSPPQVLAIGYLMLIAIGTFLLQLPFAVQGEERLALVDALFTATSATAITGLVVVNTGETFTVFGQVIIMVLFQIGALGFMTVTTLYAIILGKNISLRQRMVLQSSLNHLTQAGILKLTISIVSFALIVEGIAAIILFLKWYPTMGVTQGAYYAVFHAVSSFANAGFDLFENSLHQYTGDLVVNLTITFLFITGGLGYYVIMDLLAHKGRFKKLALHSKIVITFSVILGIIGILTILLFESNNPKTLGELSLTEKLLGAYFQGLTPRSAGFSTIEIGEMTSPSILMTMVLMLIGGGTGGTAGGIKVTTFAVLILVIYALVKGRGEVSVFKRRISYHIILKAIAITIISLVGVFFLIICLMVTEKAPFEVIMFEALSAFFTVGLSMGLTGDLTPVGKVLLSIAMFVGRIGPMTIAFALALRLQKSSVRYIEEDITVG
ncbi:trk system potassium uptake protein TrkH [Desulfitispora alkaliphila]|uniref:TrkH family potassium uptake protein n=1 Tax=Desulfitispora alkaliphila TaxID=622674 RepID=UPI003D1DD7C1